MQEWLARRKIFDLEAEMHGRASEQPYEALLEARAIKRDLREERAAIAEYDGGLSREDAERMADGLPPRFQPLNPVVADYLRRVAEVEDWPKVRKARDGTTGT
jgi:hypothetical protein